MQRPRPRHEVVLDHGRARPAPVEQAAQVVLLLGCRLAVVRQRPFEGGHDGEPGARRELLQVGAEDSPALKLRRRVQQPAGGQPASLAAQVGAWEEEDALAPARQRC